jgi:hypothetical protein
MSRQVDAYALPRERTRVRVPYLTLIGKSMIPQKARMVHVLVFFLLLFPAIGPDIPLSRTT